MKEYVKNSAAIYMDKDIGWITYIEPTGSNLPYPTLSESWSKDDTTLYLSIASFRDSLCPKTLFNAFSKAAHPKRITLGVVQQNEEGDIDCLVEYCRLMKEAGLSSGDSCPFEANVRISRVDAKIAKGPTWGRAKASQLLRDEEFCMQTDAHMDFVPEWDIKMMKMWADTKNEYAVLSTYVTASAQLAMEIMPGSKGMSNSFEVPHLCMMSLEGSHGMPRVWGTKCMRNMPRPKMTNAVWGAGLSFSKCHAERKVPYDPHTPYIFDGEEFSRAIRFWTWGYDIYTPNRVYVVHDYDKSQSDSKRSTWYANKPTPNEGTFEQSVYRLQTLLEMPGGATDSAERLAMHQSKYGLGDRRTLDQAIAFSGVDTKNRKIMSNRCGNLDFVRFTEHPCGAEYVPPYDPETEAFVGVRDPGSIYYNSSSREMRKMWEEAVVVMGRQQQVQEVGSPQLRSKNDKPSISGVAHIVHVSFGDGHGLHSQHEPDGSLVMVLLIAVIGTFFNVFCRRRCHIGKGLSREEHNGISVKTV